MQWFYIPAAPSSSFNAAKMSPCQLQSTDRSHSGSQPLPMTRAILVQMLKSAQLAEETFELSFESRIARSQIDATQNVLTDDLYSTPTDPAMRSQASQSRARSMSLAPNQFMLVISLVNAPPVDTIRSCSKPSIHSRPLPIATCAFKG